MRGVVSLLIAFALGGAIWASVPIKGWVVDRNGAPIEGAKVYVKRPKNQVKSNDTGEFCLTDAGAADMVYVKVKNKVYDIAVGERKSLYIVISDLPVVGEEKKEEDIGPRRILYGKELIKSGQTDLVEALRRFNGVNVSKDGKVKMNRAISLNLNTDPVWIVDGVMISGVPSLSVYDVESIEVIKDGLGYGLLGANGVILVTTKKMK